MAGAPHKPADIEWIHTLQQEGPIPFATSSLCSYAWSSPPTHNFLVRGADYLDTLTKVPAAGEPLLQPIALDIVKSSSKITNIMDHPQCRVRAALRAARESAKSSSRKDSVGNMQEPFVWVFNLQLPSKENLCIVMYFVSFHSPEKGSLMQRFLDGDDEFRNERLKMIVNIPQAPRIVMLARRERGQGCLIGKAMSCRYTREKDYMEVDVDMGMSMVARAAFRICGRFAALVTADYGFTLEGMCENELPERLVCALRLANHDFACATFFDPPLQSEADSPVSKGKQKAFYRGLWKSSSTHHARTGPLSPSKDGEEDEKLCDGTSKKISCP